MTAACKMCRKPVADDDAFCNTPGDQCWKDWTAPDAARRGFAAGWEAAARWIEDRAPRSDHAGSVARIMLSLASHLRAASPATCRRLGGA